VLLDERVDWRLGRELASRSKDRPVLSRLHRVPLRSADEPTMAALDADLATYFVPEFRAS
jgi:hypothetical protein